MQRKSPIKSFKLTNFVSGQFIRKLLRHIFQHSNAAQASDIYSDEEHPSTQNRHQSTSLSHACSAQHACVTQASPGPQKQRDLQAEPLRFTTLPVLCKPHHIYKIINKTKIGFKRKRRHINPRRRSRAPSFTHFKFIKKIKFTQLQKRCANDGITGCINISFWPC